MYLFPLINLFSENGLIELMTSKSEQFQVLNVQGPSDCRLGVAGMAQGSGHWR